MSSSEICIQFATSRLVLRFPYKHRDERAYATALHRIIVPCRQWLASLPIFLNCSSSKRPVLYAAVPSELLIRALQTIADPVKARELLMNHGVLFKMLGKEGALQHIQDIFQYLFDQLPIFYEGSSFCYFFSEDLFHHPSLCVDFTVDPILFKLLRQNLWQPAQNRGACLTLKLPIFLDHAVYGSEGRVDRRMGVSVADALDLKNNLESLHALKARPGPDIDFKTTTYIRLCVGTLVHSIYPSCRLVELRVRWARSYSIFILHNSSLTMIHGNARYTPTTARIRPSHSATS